MTRVDPSPIVVAASALVACNTLYFNSLSDEQGATGTGGEVTSATPTTSGVATLPTSAAGSGASEAETAAGASMGEPGTSTTVDFGSTGPGSMTGEETANGSGSAASGCGNGNIDAGERCDDGNAMNGDECNSTCGMAVVFVTSLDFSGALGGLQGADMLCYIAALANHDLFPRITSGGSRVRAWLGYSDSGTVIGPLNRFPASTVAYVRAGDHAVVAWGWGDLVDGTLQAAINQSEFGFEIEAGYVPVWTNLSHDGTVYGEGDCQGWNSGSNSRESRVGNANAVDDAWMNGGKRQCSMPARLYCVEIDCAAAESVGFCK